MGDFLIWLMGVDAPPGTTLRTSGWDFRGLMPWYVGLILLAVLGAYVVFLYFKERARLSAAPRIALAAVRTLLFAIVIFLLCRPTLLAEFEGKRKRGVVFLFDNSESIQQQDRRLTPADKARVAVALGKVGKLEFVKTMELDKATGQEKERTKVDLSKIDVNAIPDMPKEKDNKDKNPTRREMVEATLKNDKWKLFGDLEKIGPLRTFVFGTKVTPVHEETDKGDVVKQVLDKLSASDSATSLADSIYSILQRKDGDLPAAIVVVTDGRDNNSKFTLSEAAMESARLGVPVYVYGVGSTDAGSLQLREITTPPSVFVDDDIALPIHWRAHGLKKGTLEITVRLGRGRTGKDQSIEDKIVVRKEIPFTEGDDLRELLKFSVPKGDLPEENLKLTTTIELKGNKEFKDTITKDIRVVDRKIKVLVIEHAPRFEYKYLQAALLRDKRIDPHFLLVNADPRAVKNEPKFIDEFPKLRQKFFDAKYNVIIMGDVDAKYLSKEQMDWIKEFVANRGGLIVISGRQHMPSEYGPTPLGEVLPVEFLPWKAKLPTDDRTPEYPVTLTELGQRTEFMSLAETPEENMKIWQSLPGFYGFYPITKLRPGAQVLIENPRAKLDEKTPMPVMVQQYYGKGQVIFMGTDETWRWRMNAENKHFVRFWGQLLYQMGLPSLLGSTSNRVQFALDRSEAVLRRPSTIYVRLLDKDFNPRKDEKVDATLEYRGTKQIQEKSRKLPLQAIPGRDGEYQGFLMNDVEGPWEVKVHNPELSTFTYRVETPPGHEREESGLAEAELSDLAKSTGGRYYREEDMHNLSADVKPQMADFTRRQEIVLWTPLVFLLFLLLITIEWVGRKFSNLI